MKDFTESWYASAPVAEREVFKSWIKSHLAMGEVKIKFLKKDNTMRDMRCTLSAEHLPATKETTQKERKENTEVLAVWDMDKNAWRAVRYDAIKEIRFDI